MIPPEIMKHLLPCFAAALAVQRAIELADLGVRQIKSSADWPSKKSWYLVAIFAITLIAVVLSGRNLLVLGALGVETNLFLDQVLSALVISGGTETINELLKFAGYKKDETKAAAQTLLTQPPAPGKMALPATAVHLQKS